MLFLGQNSQDKIVFAKLLGENSSKPYEMLKKMISSERVRLVVICFVAASLGLPVAIISIAKFVLFATVLLTLLSKQRPTNPEGLTLQQLWTTRLALAVLAIYAVSILWSTAPSEQALVALAKYGKLLVFPAFLVLIRTRQEALSALVAFMCAQAFLLVSSWLLYFHVPVPWATSVAAKVSHAVFSSYLDQGIISAVMAAVFWHLRILAADERFRLLATVMAFAAIGNVFVAFVGRTGHLVGVAMMSLAIFWALPNRLRAAALVVPPLIFMIAVFSFDKVASRFSSVKTDLVAYSSKPESVTSTGVRLSFWKTTAGMISEKPVLGYGAGSWATEYNRVDRRDNPAHTDLDRGSNPHQEFLLWGTQLGLGGIVLLAGFLFSVMRDLRRMEPPLAKAGLSVLLALVISCFLNSSLYDAYIGDFFCISLAVLLAFGARRQRDSSAQGATS